jgi:hypothetical protein
MKECPKCGAQLEEKDGDFCFECGAKVSAVELKRNQKPKGGEGIGKLVGDKNLINESTFVGEQETYEATNMTVNNTTTTIDLGNDTLKMVTCCVSGKQVKRGDSAKCKECGNDVSLEYYFEHSKRCENCEQEAREEYRVYSVRVVGGAGSIDAARKRQLDAEAKRLKIDASAQASILRQLQQRSAGEKPKELSSVQRVELDVAVKRLVRADDMDDALENFRTISALHEDSANSEVDYWYYLVRALVEPVESVNSYEEELTDKYWQRYWGYLAYFNTGSAKGAAAIVRLSDVYPERTDDIRLAEVAYYLARGFDSFELSMLERASELSQSISKEQLSRPLVMVYDALQTIVTEGISLETEYTPEDMFVFINIFRAGKYIKYLADERERQQQEERQAQDLKKQKEREEAERQKQQAKREQQEREEAERRRQQEQAAMAAERAKRMDEEIARLSGKPTQNANQKAFAGYETEPPKKKSKLVRNIVIGVIVLIVIIGILFLIPAPESLQ